MQIFVSRLSLSLALSSYDVNTVWVIRGSVARFPVFNVMTTSWPTVEENWTKPFFSIPHSCHVHPNIIRNFSTKKTTNIKTSYNEIPCHDLLLVCFFCSLMSFIFLLWYKSVLSWAEALSLPVIWAHLGYHEETPLFLLSKYLLGWTWVNFRP